MNGLTTAWVWTAAGGLTATPPAYLYFTSYPPPLWPGVTLLTTALSVALLYRVSASKKHRDALIRKGTRVLLGALAILMVYVLMLRWTTIVVPQDSNERLQLGFGVADWTLTTEGEARVRATPGITPLDLLLRAAAVDQDQVFRFWEPITVYGAGAVLIILYLSGFWLWTSAFAYFARHQLARTA